MTSYTLKNNNKTVNLISREESAGLKGLLMSLIIMGHLRGISGEFQMYLYCFHVQCFFMLPFLYNIKPLDSKSFFNLCVKLLYPFLILYIFQIILAIFIFHDSYFTESTNLIPGINNKLLGAWSFISGGMFLIDKFCGTQFLWFFLCYFSMTVIRSWYHYHKFETWQKCIIFSIGLICYVLYAVFPYGNPFQSDAFLYISNTVSPFSIWQGFGYFTLGTFVLFILKHLNHKYLYWFVIGAIICSVIYFMIKNLAVFETLRFICPVIFFISFYYFRSIFSKNFLLRLIGTHSLAIYVIHPFLCIAWGILVPEYIQSNLIVLITQFMVVLFLSLLIAIGINKLPCLRKLIFPRGEDFNLNYAR